MNVPTPELTDLAKPVRVKLERLLHEKSVLGYAFSWTKLHALLANFVDDENEIAALVSDCVLGVDDRSITDAKKAINDKISEIYVDHDLKSLRAQDPFGRRMDYLMYETKTPPRLSGTKLVELAPSLGVSVKKALELVEKATTPGVAYVTVVARGVKEGGSDK